MLPNALRTSLVTSLLLVPDIRNSRRRDELLLGLPSNVVDGLSRDGSARTDLSLMIDQLDKLGTISQTGERPVIVLGRAALAYVEGTDGERAIADVLADLAAHYAGGAIAWHPHPTSPLPTPTHSVTLPEAILFKDQRVSFDFVQRAMSVAVSVGRLTVPQFFERTPAARTKQYFGTGWLLTPSLLITNHHVVAARTPNEPSVTQNEIRVQARQTTIRFDYLNEHGPYVECAAIELAHTNAALDYAILRIANTSRPPLKTLQAPPSLRPGDRLNVVQHPGGRPMQYAIRGNHYVGDGGPGYGHLLRYLSDTEPGSSGSPVLDDSWTVVAIHRASTSVAPQTHPAGPTCTNNEGVSLHAILSDLPSALMAEVEATRMSNVP